MAKSVDDGLKANDSAGMKFLRPTARRVADCKFPDPLENSFLKKAIVGALAVMERTTGRGVICAAPTAGSAGIVPGTLHALRKHGASDDHLRNALKVMALIGALFAVRSTYAAETGGCSVETGASASRMLRAWQGISTSPPTGSHTKPSVFMRQIEAAPMICAGLMPAASGSNRNAAASPSAWPAAHRS
jgi:L-serine deaminase